MRKADWSRCFRIDTLPDEKGKPRRKATYIGALYTVDPAAKHAALKRSATLWAAGLVAYAAAGLLPSCAVASERWVMAAYLFSLLPLYFGGLGLWTAAQKELPFTEMTKTDGWLRLKMSAVFMLLLGALWFGTGLVFLLLRGIRSSAVLEPLFLLLAILYTACGLGVYKTVSAVDISIVRPAEKTDEPKF